MYLLFYYLCLLVILLIIIYLLVVICYLLFVIIKLLIRIIMCYFQYYYLLLIISINYQAMVCLLTGPSKNVEKLFTYENLTLKEVKSPEGKNQGKKKSVLDLFGKTGSDEVKKAADLFGNVDNL